ncbi:methyltransferase, FxLD system [Sphaerisporangium sp. NPDC051017]|uniref:methyltransferase, FxLD system n=1 Tax=Sphaerisporangium sp. NPDC051017 TaxID=3154636 RepID=UPI003429803D
MTTVRDSSVQDAAASLRAAMVGALRDMDAITSERVAAAIAAVPRHLFAVGEPLEAAYAANNALVIKRGLNGAAISSLSATHIQAVMLEQAEIEPGMRVLEIGSGGYNAALIQELVGDGGKVTSVDIDPEIVARARTCLDAAGYDRVKVVLADAENGVPEGAPYDRIIVTAGAWDIPPAWVDQLSARGRIVVPLRMRGLTRSVAFDRDSLGLASHSYRLSGFVPMQGSGSHSERIVTLDEGVALRVDDESQQFDVEALREALRSPRLERWSGAAFDLPDELELFLVTSAPRVALLHASEELVERGYFAPSAAKGVPALIRGGSFAYRTKRPNEETGGFESGVFAHGPEAEAVAAQYVDLLRRWASDHCRRGAARLGYIPKAAGATEPSQGLVTKRHGVVTISWS